MERLDPVQGGRRVGQLAMAVVEGALAAADARKLKRSVVKPLFWNM